MTGHAVTRMAEMLLSWCSAGHIGKTCGLHLRQSARKRQSHPSPATAVAQRVL